MSTATLRSETSPRTWAIAWALTLALHLLIAIGLQLQHRWTPAAPRPITPAPIRLTFVGKPPASTDRKQPTPTQLYRLTLRSGTVVLSGGRGAH